LEVVEEELELKCVQFGKWQVIAPKTFQTNLMDLIPKQYGNR